jgi:Arc/MetJ-type ribon-helix-helix transcriptional regulator
MKYIKVNMTLAGNPDLSEVRIISVKIPEDVYQEMALRIPEGDRSTFIREAISEKLQKTPKPDKLLALEERMGRIEQEFGQIRKYLADLEILTFQHGKINPHQFCIDELDHKIMEYLLHYKSATTPELADYLKTNRWLILNRLRKIQKTSKKQVGKAIIEYYAGEKSGKKKAWWVDEELIQE